MEKEINIAEILKDKPQGTKLYIDDKKIEVAAREAADLYEQNLPIMSYNEDTEVDGQHHFCQEFGAELFKDGAKWAINEFLKGLWYPANEEPKHDKQITYVWGNGIAKTIILNEEADKFNRTPSQIWHNICKNYKVARWLYIDDLLLPKKGGEE